LSTVRRRSIPLVVIFGVVSIAGAQGVRELVDDESVAREEPFAPSRETARVVSLGYREAAADLLFFRVIGYFGGLHYTASGVANLIEAINTLDPHYYNIYRWGALAILMAARKDPDPREMILRAIALLERGIALYPNDYKLPQLAGESYLVDLKTKDPAQRRAWDEKGTRLLEAAVRKPGAPAESVTWIADLRSRLGQKQRAADGLREMLLITDDEKARAEILAKLAELEKTDSAELAAEILGGRKRFETEWQRERPFMPPSMFVLVGPHTSPGFDMADLATGGRNLIGTDQLDR